MSFYTYWQFVSLDILKTWTFVSRGFFYLKTTRTNTFIAVGTQVPMLNISSYFLKERNNFINLEYFNYLAFLVTTYKQRLFKSYTFNTISGGSFGLKKKERRSVELQTHLQLYITNVFRTFFSTASVEDFFIYINGKARHIPLLKKYVKKYFAFKYRQLNSYWHIYKSLLTVYFKLKQEEFNFFLITLLNVVFTEEELAIVKSITKPNTTIFNLSTVVLTHLCTFLIQTNAWIYMYYQYTELFPLLLKVTRFLEVRPLQLSVLKNKVWPLFFTKAKIRLTIPVHTPYMLTTYRADIYYSKWEQFRTLRENHGNTSTSYIATLLPYKKGTTLYNQVLTSIIKSINYNTYKRPLVYTIKNICSYVHYVFAKNIYSLYKRYCFNIKTDLFLTRAVSTNYSSNTHRVFEISKNYVLHNSNKALISDVLFIYYAMQEKLSIDTTIPLNVLHGKKRYNYPRIAATLYFITNIFFIEDSFEKRLYIFFRIIFFIKTTIKLRSFIKKNKNFSTSSLLLCVDTSIRYLDSCTTFYIVYSNTSILNTVKSIDFAYFDTQFASYKILLIVKDQFYYKFKLQILYSLKLLHYRYKYTLKKMYFVGSPVKEYAYLLVYSLFYNVYKKLSIKKQCVLYRSTKVRVLLWAYIKTYVSNNTIPIELLVPKVKSTINIYRNKKYVFNSIETSILFYRAITKYTKRYYIFPIIFKWATAFAYTNLLFLQNHCISKFTNASASNAKTQVDSFFKTVNIEDEYIHYFFTEHRIAPKNATELANAISIYAAKNMYVKNKKVSRVNSYFLKYNVLTLKQQLLSILSSIPKTFSVIDYTSQPYNGCKKAKRYKKRSF